MNPRFLPADEAERLRLLHELQLAGDLVEPAFDAIVRLAASHTGCTMAAFSLVDVERQWFKASIGLDLRETPRANAFCAHAILTSDVFVVPDALVDTRFAANPLVAGQPGVRFYAGAPITLEGHRLGTVCCFADHERTLESAAQQGLRDLAQLAAALLRERLWARRLALPPAPVLHAADESTRAAEERWRLAAESGGQGVWDWDARKQGLYFSDALKAIIGHAGDEIGTQLREWLSRVHPDDLTPAKTQLVAHLRGETAMYLAEHRMRHKAGHDVWVMNSGRVVSRSKSGRALRMVGTLTDVTSQRHAESRLRDKRAAELARVAKSEFLSRMSHEMRTPLNAVIGFTQLLLSRPDTPDAMEVRDYAAHVLRAGQQLLALTNDVLDLQHVEEGRAGLDIADVALDSVVAEVIGQLTASALERGVAFHNHVPDGVEVRADERRLVQVLHNIASNAVKYNRPAGVVRWSVEPDNGSGRVRLNIEDTGSGLKPAQLERLFQPFERLGKETSTIEGTGLGLIIARSLAIAMGGTLEVASHAGVGTRVTIDLPMAQQTALPFTQPGELSDCEPDPADKASLAEPVATPSTSSLRMLYVEDNRINAILFEEAIRLRHDVELRLAEDGKEALDQVRHWKPDVLVLDAHLPGMDGFQLLGALRREPGLSDVPAFMCSADAMPDDVQRAAEAGFAGYWAKPINLAKIMNDLDRLSAGLPPSPVGDHA